MPFQFPTPNDYSNQPTDILKIRAALLDNDTKLIYFPEMYHRIDAEEPSLPIMSGKTLMGPGKFGGCGISSNVAGHLFESSNDLDGFTIRGLQLLGGDGGLANGNAIKVTTPNGRTSRWILLDDCLIRCWYQGSVYISGTSMYHRINNCRFACDSYAHQDSACVYIDGGTLECQIAQTAIGGPRLLLRSFCDGLSVVDGGFEAVSSDAIRIDGGTTNIISGWFDETYLGTGKYSINAVAGSTVNVSGSPRGLTAARLHGSIICTPSF